MKILIVLACFAFSLTSYSQTIEIPDKNFECALIDYGIDSDKKINGKLLISDAKKVAFLDLSNKKIENLIGIESFTSLEYLDCRNNYLSNLDLSKNSALSALFSDVNDVIKSDVIFDVFDWFN
ncbi:hypothetical protein A9Q87_11870 [Flavobacteriales bacterium 34_180_T64]|mgnify:CR=1 FL=1|nr:hypothetical protein A9Q87_11870 [Flavobacteriales bacterium 34_180_T64]